MSVMRATVSWYGCCILLLMAYDPGQGVAHAPPSPTAAPDRCRKCPYFLATPTHVTTPVGAAANLTCGVRTLGDRQVSWIRRRDLHVLTTDSFTYTTDTRFGAVHAKSSPYWVLSVSSPSVSDSGVYECQVSTQPKISKRFTLDVIEPEASILGSDAVYMRAGSDLNITCIISGATPQTASVTWYHVPTGLGISGRSSVVEEVNSGGRGGVQLVTDRRAGTSWLLVTRATRGDAGNYTCAPARARHASVVVHVLEDESPAAMQPHRQATDAPPAPRDSSSSSSSSSSSAGPPSSVVSSTRAFILISLLRLFFKMIYFPRDCDWLCSRSPRP